MSNLVDVLVPDIGNFDSVDVIEVLVKVGDELALEDSLITVESDKASMDIPSPVAGIVKSVTVKVGDKVAKDSLLMQVESQAQAAKSAPAAKAEAQNQNLHLLPRRKPQRRLVPRRLLTPMPCRPPMCMPKWWSWVPVLAVIPPHSVPPI
jgi:pyruvate/2-oxoglutarate dehydrogenase complex dihydrolipoamide acyltransferase (E2) component